MKFLCLAYGDEKDWQQLDKSEQDALLAQDDVLRRRGDVVAAVETDVTTLRAWDGTPRLSEGPFARGASHLAGFAVIEAADRDEVVRLIAHTPCARAGGAIEIRPIMTIDNLGVTPNVRPESPARSL